MKYIVKYNFGSQWYAYTEHEDMYSAKKSMRELKKNLGTSAKVKIVTEG